MVIKDGAKMSKSKGNVVDPDELVDRYGADTARLFSLFAAPPEKDLEWSDRGVEGASRFLHRLWTLVTGHLDAVRLAPPVDAASLSPALRDVRRAVHQTLAKVTLDLGDRFAFNTAIAAVMELTNTLMADLAQRGELDTAAASVYREAFSLMVFMLNPMAPHVTEELASMLGLPPIWKSRFPAHDADAARDDKTEYPVQVNGKLRGKVVVGAGAAPEEVEALAKADPALQPWLAGKEIVKIIVAKGRLVNIVVKG
jgi:leucyl-tRNA synthetase